MSVVAFGSLAVAFLSHHFREIARKDRNVVNPAVRPALVAAAVVAVDVVVATGTLDAVVSALKSWQAAKLAKSGTNATFGKGISPVVLVVAFPRFGPLEVVTLRLQLLCVSSESR